MSYKTTLHFYGGAGNVTGSNFLLESGGVRALIDCGLTQGKDSAEEMNWEKFPYDPATIPFLFVTHAHIDHIGRIPKLIKDGFKGRIISTDATKALAEPLLLDAVELLEHEAEKHSRELLYTKDDIAKAMRHWEGTSYHTEIEVGEGITAEFLNAGHILGSSMIRFEREGKTLVFTGDLGGGNSPLLSETEDIAGATYAVMESVYGDRLHENRDGRRDVLRVAIEEARERDNVLLIPSFSICSQSIQEKIGLTPNFQEACFKASTTETYESIKLKFPVVKPARIFKEAPPLRDELTIF